LAYNCLSSPLELLLRICLISREYPPDTGWGGVGAYNHYMAHALKAAGHDVEVIALSGNDESSCQNGGGITVNRVAWKHLLEELNLFLVSVPTSHYVIKTTLALWKRFLEIHGERPFDVVEIPEHLSAGIFHALTRPVPLVITLHTPHSKFIHDCFHGVTPSFDNRLICIMERVGINLADLLISPSDNLARFVAEDTGCMLESINVIRTPIDTQKFSPEGRRAFDSEGKPTVFFAGRLEERKGIQILIEAVPSIVKRVPDVQFVCVGADTKTAPDGGSMLTWLNRQLSGSGCTSKVKFIPHIPLSAMPDYIRSADICVVPSLYDNAPLTCIEALACGKPVVATSAGGMSEYAIHKERGLIVPPRSPEEIADAICTLLLDNKLRLQYGHNARQFAQEQLNLAVKADERVRVYQKARDIFQRKTADPVYRRGGERSLRDSLEILCAYEQMLFETLSKQSLDFRMRHWFRLFKKRPRLCAASLLVAAYRGVFGTHSAASPLIAKLEVQIELQKRDHFSQTLGFAQLAEQLAQSSGVQKQTDSFVEATPAAGGKN
jgi:glycosyltransferase involved in cell wall biosynthesis